MNLSKNFKLSELTRSGDGNITPTYEQLHCLKLLVNNILQPIRDKFGPVSITSGLRDKETYDRLISKGYPASRTSDHFAWSTVNPKGTGAADITLPGTDLNLVFHWIIDNLDSNIRQVIHYPDKYFIHVSNAFKNIFTCDDPMHSINKILVYRDGIFTPYIRSY